MWQVYSGTDLSCFSLVLNTLGRVIIGVGSSLTNGRGYRCRWRQTLENAAALHWMGNTPHRRFDTAP
jgi:hypothetical protein